MAFSSDGLNVIDWVCRPIDKPFVLVASMSRTGVSRTGTHETVAVPRLYTMEKCVLSFDVHLAYQRRRASDIIRDERGVMTFAVTAEGSPASFYLRVRVK